MSELQDYMEELHTDPEICTQIIEGLNRWREGINTSFTPLSTAQLTASLQENIGWKHFFEGRHHLQWRELQSEYLRNIRSLRSGKRWSIAIIKKLWEIAWDLWEQRNGRLHHKEEGWARVETERKIQELWRDQRIHTKPSVEKLLPKNVEEVLAKSTQQRQQWLVRMEAALRQGQTTTTFRYEGERRSMQRYLIRKEK
jgi:hypothetical protein